MRRVIQQAFIDMENMFDLMKEEQEVSSAVAIVIHAALCYAAVIKNIPSV